MAVMKITKEVIVNNRPYRSSRSIESNNNSETGGTSVPAAKDANATLTVRTDNDTGTLTCKVGHGINTGDKVDLYWVEAGVNKRRRYVTVGVVAGQSVPIDLGAGDNLPAAATAGITVSVCLVDGGLNLTGNNVVGIAVSNLANERGIVNVLSAADAELDTRELASGETYTWDSGDGSTNPLAGDTVAKVVFSHSDPNAPATMRCNLLYN
jgi:hypothetical protein